jgi:hypothetical protein
MTDYEEFVIQGFLLWDTNETSDIYSRIVTYERIRASKDFQLYQLIQKDNYFDTQSRVILSKIMNTIWGLYKIIPNISALPKVEQTQIDLMDKSILALAEFHTDNQRIQKRNNEYLILISSILVYNLLNDMIDLKSLLIYPDSYLCAIKLDNVGPSINRILTILELVIHATQNDHDRKENNLTKALAELKNLSNSFKDIVQVGRQIIPLTEYKNEHCN